MKYNLVNKKTITIFIIDERRMILDILDPVYKDILKQIKSLDKDVLVDMRKVEYVDSFAVGFLMDIFRMLLDSNHKLTIGGVNEKISTLLKITRVNNVVKVFPTIEEASKELKI
jgi:anti-anti-sigma factor